VLLVVLTKSIANSSAIVKTHAIGMAIICLQYTAVMAGFSFFYRLQNTITETFCHSDQY